jgi:hypothetical protein
MLWYGIYLILQNVNEIEIIESEVCKKFMTFSTDNTVQLLKTFHEENIMTFEPFRSCAAALSTINLAILERMKSGGALNSNSHFAEAYKFAIITFATKVKYDNTITDFESHKAVDDLLLFCLERGMMSDSLNKEEKAQYVFFAGCLTVLQVAKTFADIPTNKVTLEELTTAVAAIDDFNVVTMDLFREYIKQLK